MEWAFFPILFFHLNDNRAEIFSYSLLETFGPTFSAMALTAWTTSFCSKDEASFKNGSFNTTCLYTGMVDVSLSSF